MRFLFVIAAWCGVVQSCDFLYLAPCNQTSKTCFIHRNVCAATDLIFSGFGPGWTFSFVTYNNIDNNTRCMETNGALNAFCLAPAPATTALDVYFALTTVSQQGIFDDDVRFVTLPPQGTAILTIMAYPVIAVNGITSVLTVTGNTFSAQNITFSGASTANVPLSCGILIVGNTGTVTLNSVQFNATFAGAIVLSPSVNVLIRYSSSVTISPVVAIRIILVLRGCSGACTRIQLQDVEQSQYVVLDWNVPVALINSTASIYNVSAIIPYSVFIPSTATIAPNIVPATPCSANRIMELVTTIAVSVLCAIIIIVVVRRHYQHAKSE